MYRVIRAGLVLSLVALVSATALGCKDNEVSVRTGLRVLCKYNHVVKDTSRYIKVEASRAKYYKVGEETTVCPLHKRAQRLYTQAQRALAKGKKAKAKKLLAQVVKVDPTFKKAGKQYESLGGKTPSTGLVATTAGGSGGSSSQGGASPSPTPGNNNKPKPTQTTGTYLSRIPKSLRGYKLLSQHEDMLSGTRVFAARSAASRVRLLTANVTFIGKKTGFSGWYKRLLANRYSVGALRTVSNKRARFGTDGDKFANLCWAENGLVFQIEIEARRGKPTTLKSEAISVANRM